MSHKKNRTISYLYQEMDPSERMEFERELKQDENLLIEVESLKAVREKLSTLNTISPAAEVTENLYLELSARNRLRRLSKRRNATLAAAAVLLISITSLSYLFLYSPGTDGDSTGTEASVSLSGTGTLFHSMASDSRASATEQERSLQPWVDSNEIIHFIDRFQASEASALDSIYQQSMQRLTPVIKPGETQSPGRQLQLTGTRR